MSRAWWARKALWTQVSTVSAVFIQLDWQVLYLMVLSRTSARLYTRPLFLQLRLFDVTTASNQYIYLSSRNNVTSACFQAFASVCSFQLWKALFVSSCVRRFLGLVFVLGHFWSFKLIKTLHLHVSRAPFPASHLRSVRRKRVKWLTGWKRLKSRKPADSKAGPGYFHCTKR